MDFAKTHKVTDGVIAQSKLCLYKPKDPYTTDIPKIRKSKGKAVGKDGKKSATSHDNTNISNDNQEITIDNLEHLNGIASNSALSTEISPLFTTSSTYKDSLLPRSSLISGGSLVVVYSSWDSLSFVYAEKGAIHSNRNGVFFHDDFIGEEYGVKVPSRATDGFIYALRPTPELWARSLPHRTQIVHELDQSMVVFVLDLKPGCVVLESGTGSGAMSTAIARAVAPGGKVWTYEFNKDRADKATEEVRKEGWLAGAKGRLERSDSSLSSNIMANGLLLLTPLLTPVPSKWTIRHCDCYPQGRVR